MTACTATVRRPLHTLADALADFIEAESAKPLAALETSSDSQTHVPEPNPEMAEAFTRRELRRQGAPVPPRRRGAG